ncbi:MAG: hypothetical protein ABJM29_21130 [Rhizobiaceae bacterium]
MKFKLLSEVSFAGSDTKANEDRHGHCANTALVADGATGLGDRQYMDGHDSDAAWLAKFATDHLLTSGHDFSESKEVFANLMTVARDEFFAAAAEQDIPRYAWPCASIALLSLQERHLQFSGLGDCTAYIRPPGEQVQKYSALRDYAQAESAFAKIHVEKARGIKGESLLHHPETLDDLRRVRAAQNTPEGNVWTLGLVPTASEQLQQTNLAAVAGTQVLICSDGFSALEDAYDCHSPASLLQSAGDRGLEALYRELRHIEHTIDPLAEKFPRFKRSDDATAIHLVIE